MKIILTIFFLVGLSHAIEIIDDECGDAQDCREFSYASPSLFSPHTIKRDGYEINISAVDYNYFIDNRNIARVVNDQTHIPFTIAKQYQFFTSNQQYQFILNDKNQYLIKSNENKSIVMDITNQIPLDLSFYKLDLRKFNSYDQTWKDNSLILNFYTPNRLPHLCINIVISNLQSRSPRIEKKTCDTFSFPIMEGNLISPNKVFEVKENSFFANNKELFGFKEMFKGDFTIEGFWLDNSTLFVSKTDDIDFEGPIVLLKIEIQQL